jgi:bacteriorhodopsin
MCGSLTLLVWFTYPVAWALGEGSNVISPDAEAIFYGLLDIISKPVFGGLLLWGHRNIDPASLGLSVHDYEGSIYSDKSSFTITEPVMLGDMAPRGSSGAIQVNANESAV